MSEFKRRHAVGCGGAIAVAFLVIAVARLLIGNGVLWRF